MVILIYLHLNLYLYFHLLIFLINNYLHLAL